jgi:hypothetical protein
MNESESNVAAGHHIYERNRSITAIPAYLILDHNHRSRYSLDGFQPDMPIPRSEVKSGFVTQADTLHKLAAELGIDASGLEKTIARFNAYARAGLDPDYHRGESDYDLYFGDSTVKPNPCLASIERSPFYALKIWPGDFGTKGGLLTDEFARFLRHGTTKGAPATKEASASASEQTNEKAAVSMEVISVSTPQVIPPHQRWTARILVREALLDSHSLLHGLPPTMWRLRNLALNLDGSRALLVRSMHRN